MALNKDWKDLPAELAPTAGETLAEWHARIAAYDLANPGVLTFLSAAALEDVEARAQAEIDALASRLPSVNVADYGATGNGTDQTAALNAAIAALPAAGGVLLFPKVGGDYRHTGLNFDSRRSVILRGQGGGSSGVAPGTTLYYTGTTGSAISARSTVGFTIIDMWVSYTQSAFNGRLLDLRGGLALGDTSEPCLVRCRVGSGAIAPYNAIGMDLDEAINGSFYRSNFALNYVGVRGKSINSSYSIRHSFFGGRFSFSRHKHVLNAGASWAFYGPTVQQLAPGAAVPESAGFIGYDPGVAAHSLTIDGAWMGDVAPASTTPQIDFCGSGLAVRGSRIANGGSAVGIDCKPPTTTLNGAITNAVTTITVLDAMLVFGDSGTILIGSEEIAFTGRTATMFTGCTRGANGTAAASHATAATVHLLGDTRGIDIDAATYFHYCTHGVVLRRGVRAGSVDIRAQGKIDGGAGALTAVSLWEDGVRGLGGDATNGLRGALVPSPAAGGEGSTTVLVANRALFGRFVPDRDMLVKAITFGVYPAASVDDPVDVGVYKVVNRALVRVGSLGATLGLLNTTGVKVATLGSPITLQRGRTYYIGLSCGAIGGTAATVIGHVMASGGFFHGLIHTVVGEWESVYVDTAHPLPSQAAVFAASTVARLGIREF